MSFLTPLAFLGALIAIPIILLYMLRLRRREVIVSSNFLWQQVLRDKEANTPWQRLKRNALLILQLIILALLVLALARPAQVVPTSTAGKTVILLDASASMNATDMDGRTRFEAALGEVLDILRESGSGDEISIIRVADVTEPLIAYTNDTNRLRAAVSNAQPGAGSGDWDTALTLAAAGAEGAESFRIIIISDGGLGDTARLPENIPQPVYIPVGQATNNLSISALAARTLPGQSPQLFVQVQNYAPVANRVSLVIRLDGELWDSVTQQVSAESQRSFVFNVEQDFTTIEAELVLDDNVVDYLTADNNAYTVAPSSDSRRVLYISSEPNIFLEQALRSIPGVQTARGDETQASLPSTAYDLYIFNDYLPTVLPDADMLIVNPPSSSTLFSLGATEDVDYTISASPISVANPMHPLAAFLNVNTVNLAQYQTLNNINWAEPIVTANNQPIIIAGENEGRQVIVMPFNLQDSDLPLHIAFPLFMSNALEWFAPANIVSGGTAYSVGDILRINPPLDATDIRVTRPTSEQTTLPVTGNTLTFAETHAAGLYQIDVLANDDITDTQVVAVNLFGTGESNIEAAANIQVGGGMSEDDEALQLGFREFWGELALLILFVLLFEWRLYHRRLRVPTEVHSDLTRTTARN